MILSHIRNQKQNMKTNTMHRPKIQRFLFLALGGLLLSGQGTLGQTATPDPESEADIKIAVVATRSEEPILDTAGTVNAITAEEIIRRGGVTLTDALRYEPGISVPFDFAGQSGFVPYLGGGDQAINIRGIEGNRVALQLDGIRQPEDFVAQAFLGAGGPGRVYFDPAILNQLEVYKSAASSLYGGDALGGVVEGRTVDPESLLGAGLDGQSVANTLTYASVNDSFNNRLTAALGDGNRAASLVYSFREGAERDNNGSAPPNPQDFDSHALVLKGVLREDTWSLRATLDGFRYQSFTDANAAEGSFFNGMVINDLVTQDDERERLRASLRGSWSPASPLALADNLFGHVYVQDATTQTVNVQQGSVQFGPFPSPRDRVNDISYETRILGIDLQADKLLATGNIFHEIRYGLEWNQTEVESQFLRIDRQPDGSTSTSNRIGMAPSEINRLGLFIQNRISIGGDEQWTLTPALRLDTYDVSPANTEAFLNRTEIPGTGESVSAIDYDNVALAPSLSVLYRWTDRTNTYATYSRGVRNPSAEELNGVFTHGTDFIVVPNPDLSEEKSNSFEVGLQHSNAEHAFQAAVFYNDYTGFLESNVVIEDNPDPEPDVQTTVNLNEVEIYGAEFRWDYLSRSEQGLLPGTEFGLSFSWTRGTQIDINQPLNSIDPWKTVAYAGFQHPSGKWGTRLTGTYHAEKEPDDINQTTDAGVLDSVDSVFLLDWNVFYQLNDHWSVNGGVKNLTDEEYFLWATARRGSGHGGGVAASRNTQPGLNGFLSLNAQF